MRRRIAQSGRKEFSGPVVGFLPEEGGNYTYDGVQVKIRAPAATFDGILIADCERHRTLYTAYEAVLRPGTAYMAGASRTMTAYLICCHFAEDDGESLVDPVELYLAGKNAVYATRDAAIAFMQDLDE